MTFSEPDDVSELADGAVAHAGGPATSPSAMPPAIRRARSPSAAATDDLDALFTGDLLFAGSIGRTDLPGGDHATILRSLARTLTLPDATVVLPGHGPQTTDRRRAPGPTRS